MRHKILGRAIMELRRRMRWSQTELAVQIGKQEVPGGPLHQPDQAVVSRWERGENIPSPIYLMALSGVAARRGHADLVKIYDAPPVAWGLAIAVVALLDHEE